MLQQSVPGKKENKTVCVGVHPHVCVAEEEKKDETSYRKMYLSTIAYLNTKGCVFICGGVCF
jgi:hypothetical protein